MKNSLLMQEFSLGGLSLRNRIVMAPMLSRLCNTDGSVSQKLIDYYVERAKGGAGLIIVEYCYIDQKESKARHGQMGAYHDRLIAGLAELAESIQECGARTILQICHAGRSSSEKFTGLKPIAPSAIPNYANEKPREMSEEEIESTVQAFADAAYRARAAGFDGVELHGGHGYLIAQFLSPYTNTRQDRYGQDRSLFGLQVLDRVRSKVGQDYVVGYRISGDEFMQGGLTAQDAQEFSVRLERQGIDYIHVSGGSAETGQNIVIPVYFPQGHLLHLAQGIKQKVHVPVIAVGAIHEPRLAEDALLSGKADLIAMGRALITDPALPEKIRTDRLDDICPCLRCNEGCRNRMMEDKAQRCAVNAEVGRERLMIIRPAAKPKRVCIIGGGPAGLEAARTLSLRGHRVTLFEQQERLGGLLRYASVPDFKSEMRHFLEYLIRQVDALKVDIRYRCCATIDMVKEMMPDAVVLATGSRPLLPRIPGVDRPFVTSALDLLSGSSQPGRKVLIAGGAAMGCEIAAHLAGQGREVTLLEMRSEIALDLEPRARMALLSLLKRGKVEVLEGWKLEKIDNGGVVVADEDQNRKMIEGDTLILATGFTPNQDLIKPLRERFSEIHIIGDCLKPRKIYQAIHEGSYAGRAI